MSQTRLPLPTDSSDLPVIEIVAQYYGFQLSYHNTETGRLYAVQDWIIGVAQTENPRAFWDALKRRVKKMHGIELSTWCRQLPYRAANNRTYQMDFASAQTLYYVTQRMDAETGIRDDVLQYLAKAGVIVDELRVDPVAVAEKAQQDRQIRRLLAEGYSLEEAQQLLESDMGEGDDPELAIHRAIDRATTKYRRQGKPDSWIVARIQGIVTRKDFVDALKAAVLNAPPTLYAQATDKLYVGLWERTTAQLRGDLNLTPRQNLRDSFGEYALIYTRLAEMVATDKLDEIETVTFSMAMEIVWEVAKLIHTQASATAQALGIDLVTERRLLKS